MVKRDYALLGAGQRRFFRFDSDLTLGQNLEAHREVIEASGILPSGFSTAEITVSYNGKSLNQAVSLEEQCPGIQEEAQLSLELVATTAQVHLQYQPDHTDLKSREFEVDLREPLDAQLRDFLEEVRSRHKFRGFRRTKFQIQAGGRSLRLDRTLASYGIQDSIKGTLVPAPPWSWFGWPFQALEWTLSAVLVAGILYLGWWLLPKSPEEIRVTFVSEIPCHVRISGLTLDVESQGTIGSAEVASVDSMSVDLPRGWYRLEYLPERRPIYSEIVQIDPKPGVSADRRLIRPPKGGKFTLTVQAYREEPVQEAWERLFFDGPMLLNGWEVAVPSQRDEKTWKENAASGLAVVEGLALGRYEIRHDVREGLEYDRAYPACVNAEKFEILRPDSFEWDFSELPSGMPHTINIVYWYRRSAAEGTSG